MKVQNIEQMTLKAYPFGKDQRVYGSPVQRISLLSEEKSKVHGIWDCCEGGFEITFDWEEFAYILEGEVEITSDDGTSKILKTGDLAHFKRGSIYRWDISRYLKKTFTAIVETGDL